jgi:hypothetical protein
MRIFLNLLKIFITMMAFQKIRSIALALLNVVFVQSLYCQNIQLTDSMDHSRSYHQSQLLSNNKVLVCGGESGIFSKVIRQSCELFDPLTSSWSFAASMNTARSRFGSMLLPNGDVLVFGGDTTGNWDATASSEIWNHLTGLWTYAESMNYARQDFSFTVLNDGRLLVAGGLPVSSVAEIFDPTTGHWTLIDSTIAERPEGSIMVALPNNKALFAGGWSFSESRTAEIYDVFTNQWDSLPQMNFDHDFGSAILLNNGTVLIAGSGFNVGTAAEIFDPIAETFTITDSLHQLRSGAPMVLLNNGNPIIFGEGDVFNGSNTQCIEVYDVPSGQWMTQTYNIIGTQHYTMHRVSGNNLLIIGGEFAFYTSQYAFYVNDNTVDISEKFIEKITVSPNPTNGWIYLNGQEEADLNDLRVCFYNMLGGIINTYDVSHSKAINVSHLAPGLYLLEISGKGNLVYRTKLLKH